MIMTSSTTDDADDCDRAGAAAPAPLPLPRPPLDLLFLVFVWPRDLGVDSFRDCWLLSVSTSSVCDSVRRTLGLSRRVVCGFWRGCRGVCWLWVCCWRLEVTLACRCEGIMSFLFIGIRGRPRRLATTSGSRISRSGSSRS
ncbi:hypothetical protein BGZ61DRAFT_464904 [Ilyonectria robusta]|uniref:uncharacterized protein n=1 Tax=Ilyonectria robusta TaxID=1079257 RepID=UPI001E8E8E8E|nr:uncharacterized protein BGZ61DRAFT_464904 [Ilyonectria robusta]KAH8659693.1 hypothetical protein BGZ61DRAFT_464904 [Ilyonectria robusta]